MALCRSQWRGLEILFRRLDDEPGAGSYDL